MPEWKACRVCPKEIALARTFCSSACAMRFRWQNGRVSKKTLRPFDHYIKKTEACWLWIGATRDGYGRYGKLRAHRVSYENANGQVPNGLMILHKCDVKNCIRPDHLYAGTAKDNGRDLSERGIFGPKNCPTSEAKEPRGVKQTELTKVHREMRGLFPTPKFNPCRKRHESAELLNTEALGGEQPWENCADDFNRSLNPDRDFSDVMED